MKNQRGIRQALFINMIGDFRVSKLTTENVRMTQQ